MPRIKSLSFKLVIYSLLEIFLLALLVIVGFLSTSKKDAAFHQGLHCLLRFCLLFLFVLSDFMCLFDLILYITSTIFQLCRDGSSWVEPVLR